MQKRVLSFWFGGTEPEQMARWWDGSPEADDAIRLQFGSLLQDAVDGKLAGWVDEGPQSCLALIITLDQFSLQVYRGEGRGYDINAMALPIAREAIARKYDADMSADEKLFSYLPFMHAEDLAVQKESVELFRGTDMFGFALKHMEPLEKYGRFPGRNKAHGRVTTPAELEYLANGGFF